MNNHTDQVTVGRWKYYNNTYIAYDSGITCTGNPDCQNGYETDDNQSWNFASSPSAPSTPAPTASLSASPSTITQGSSSTLSWSSTNATSCTGTNFSTGGSTSGSTTVAPSSSTNYVVTCSGAGGSANAQGSITVNPPQSSPTNPTNPNQCVQNKGASCTSAQNSCGQTNSGAVQCNGSCSAIPPSDAGCPQNGTGGGGGGNGGGGGGSNNNNNNQGADVCWNLPGIQTTVPSGYRYDQSSGCIPNPTAPSVSALLSASPQELIRGAAALLTWSSKNAVSCTGGNFGTAGATGGTKSVTPLETTLYALTCTDASGNKGYSTAQVKVDSPTVSVSATPTLVRSGDSATVSWKVTAGKVDSCDIEGPGLSSHTASGSKTLTITQESTYTFTCSAGPFTPSASATVKVIPSFQEI